jgi:hypothetical protein
MTRKHRFNVIHWQEGKSRQQTNTKEEEKKIKMGR